MIRPIRVLGDPILKTMADPIASFDAKLEALVSDLMDTVSEPGAAGVAAPQIGVGLRAFSYDVDGARGYVLNPEIVTFGDGEQDGLEGCLSVPDLAYPTRRAARAVVRGVDVRNRPVEVRGSGELARCLQHEVDHLDGRLYLDRLDRATRKEAYRAIRRRLSEEPAR